jgi:hypothetical protein
MAKYVVGRTYVMTISDIWDLTSDPDNPTRLSPVKIELTRDGGGVWATLEASIVNAGTYSWTVAGALSEDCYLRVSDPSDSSNYGNSDQFEITDKIILRKKVEMGNTGTGSGI